MVKRIVSGIAAAVLALGIGLPQASCVSMQDRVSSIVDSREGRVRDDISDIVDSVYCVRTEAEYVLEGAPEGTPPVMRKGHGTALAYAKRDGYVYLVTNAHVVDNPAKVEQLEIVPGPGGLSLAIKTYILQGERTYLVDDADDEDASDDIIVEEVSKDRDIDIALVKTGRPIRVSGSYSFDPAVRPRVGEEVYVVGYPRGAFSAVTRGIVAHPDFVLEGEHLDALDVTSTFGNSGSPYFVRRGEQLYWAGTVGRILSPPRSDATVLTIGIPVRRYAGMLSKTAAGGGI